MPGPLPCRGVWGVLRLAPTMRHRLPLAPRPRLLKAGSREGGGGMCSVALKPPHELSRSSQRSEVAGGHVLLGRVPRGQWGAALGGGAPGRRLAVSPGRGCWDARHRQLGTWGRSRLRAELLPSVAVGCRALLLQILPHTLRCHSKGQGLLLAQRCPVCRPTAPCANPATLEAPQVLHPATLALCGGQRALSQSLLFHRGCDM